MKYLSTLSLLLLTHLVFAQGSAINLGDDTYHILDRLEIKSGVPSGIHTSLKYYLRGEVTDYASKLDTAQVPFSAQDRFDLYYIFKSNNEWLITPQLPNTLGGKTEPATIEIVDEKTGRAHDFTGGQAEISFLDPRYVQTPKPLFGIFYKTPANFLQVNDRFFHLRINPILNFKMAKATDESGLYFLNQRGLEMRGGIDDRIYFYTSILESQARFPDYVNDRIDRDKAVPGAGLFKRFDSSILNINNGRDFLNGQAYVGFNVTKHVGFQLGHGRHFIGNGYRSLLLSDFAHNYFYMKLNWHVWKFHYQNIFAELTARRLGVATGSRIAPKKYMAAHHLSFNITPKMSFGFFETTVFSREDGEQFELQYLNPIILYRTVEQFIGSPDNVLIGLDFKWNIFNRFQLYSQLMLDEFKFNELILERRGWWANKYGIQVGGKYIDAFNIDHLDLQGEINIVRPYTYSHRDSSGSSYAHYNQPLAHPLGANFQELVMKARYQASKKLVFDGRIIFANFGEDPQGENWGGNVLLSHNLREQDFGNEIGQGVDAKTAILGLDISYQAWHNLYFELEFFYRKKNSANDNLDDTTTYFGGGVRMNIGRYRLDF